MKQTDLGLDLNSRRARKRVFLDKMERAVPWREFVALIAPDTPTKATRRPPSPVEATLGFHFWRQWFGLSDVAMEEAPYHTPLYRELAGMGGISGSPTASASSASDICSSAINWPINLSSPSTSNSLLAAIC